MRPPNVSESLTINAPAAEIFAILTDPRQHAQIDGSDSVQALIEGPERLGMASVFSTRMHFLVPYTMRNTVVEFAENHLIAWRTRAPVRWRYQLEESAGGTRVTETWDIARLSPLRRTGLQLAGFPRRSRRAIRLTLLRLKAIAESADLR